MSSTTTSGCSLSTAFTAAKPSVTTVENWCYFNRCGVTCRTPIDPGRIVHRPGVSKTSSSGSRTYSTSPVEPSPTIAPGTTTAVPSGRAKVIRIVAPASG